MIGADIIKISRIAKAVEKPAFKNRVFTTYEIAYSDARPTPAESYAGLFCAKEAAVKALKLGFFRGIAPTDVEILHDGGGAPHINTERLRSVIGKTVSADISISHDGEYAIAVAEIFYEKATEEKYNV